MVSNSRYGVQLRGAQPADAPFLATLLAEDPRAMATRLDAASRHGSVLLALGWNGAPVGVAALHWHAGLHADRPIAHLDTLFVAPEERRAGIGRLLIKAAAQAARAAGCDALHAAAEDTGTAAFLQALGFVTAAPGFQRPLRKRTPGAP